MGGLKLNHYIGLVGVLLLLFPAAILLWFSSITKELLFLSGTIFVLAVFILSDLFSDILVEKGEDSLKENDQELLKLKLEDVKFHFGIGFGLGVTLLITGITMSNGLGFVIAGLILLALSNLFYNWAYMPRQLQLTRWATATRDIREAQRRR